jgi:hypothetical protein
MVHPAGDFAGWADKVYRGKLRRVARHHSLKPRKFRIELRPSSTSSVHGGQLAVLGVLRASGLLDEVADHPALDPRRDKSHGFDPEVYVAAVLFSHCTGGRSLADVEALGEDRALLDLLGLREVPDQTTLGEWLRALGSDGARALKELNRRFCQWVLREAPGPRWLHGGEEEWFFDDTQIEVTGRKFEGAAINYNGDLALGWQTLWRGPLIVECSLGGQRDVGECFAEFCRTSAAMREDGRHYLYADSGSSDGAGLEAASEHFTRHSISYNKWVSPLERIASRLPESVWGEGSNERWRGGREHFVEYGWLRHQPEGCTSPRLYAALRHRAEGDMFWQYCFIEVEKGRGSTPAQSRAAFERHRLKGECERRFSEALTDMGLHRPPCQSLAANDAWYALGALAYNVLGALKLLVLPERDLCKRPRTVMQRLLLVPMELKRHARQLKAVLSVWEGRLAEWMALLAEWLPGHVVRARAG